MLCRTAVAGTVFRIKFLRKHDILSLMYMMYCTNIRIIYFAGCYGGNGSKRQLRGG